MNIFVTNFDPIECAKEHCVLHRNKMLVEYAQIMSTVARLQDKGQEGMYKATHIHHPSVKWAAKDKGNYAFVFTLWSSLAGLYTWETGKVHASYAKLCTKLSPQLIYVNEKIGEAKFTEDMLAMPDEFKSSDITGAYQSYLNYKFNEWKSREKPLIPYWHITSPSWLEEP